MTAILSAQKNHWKYLDYPDLLSSHIEATRLSYDTNSKEYARNWEWNDAIRVITKRDYLEPFMNEVKKGIVLVVGCGTGRDLNILEERGFRYLGIDTSMGMLKEAVEVRGVKGPVLCEAIESVNFVDESFDGILIESAIEHVRKADISNILEKLYKILRPGGTCLLRFRHGEGKVFVVEDSVGIRYFTSYSKEESDSIVTGNGFKMVKDYLTKHMEDSRPGFHAYILRK